jgi:hypothetical protein
MNVPFGIDEKRISVLDETKPDEMIEPAFQASTSDGLLNIRVAAEVK